MICGCSFDQVSHRGGIHPFQVFDACGVTALQDAADPALAALRSREGPW